MMSKVSQSDYALAIEKAISSMRRDRFTETEIAMYLADTMLQYGNECIEEYAEEHHQIASANIIAKAKVEEYAEGYKAGYEKGFHDARMLDVNNTMHTIKEAIEEQST